MVLRHVCQGGEYGAEGFLRAEVSTGVGVGEAEARVVGVVDVAGDGEGGVFGGGGVGVGDGVVEERFSAGCRCQDTDFPNRSSLQFDLALHPVEAWLLRGHGDDEIVQCAHGEAGGEFGVRGIVIAVDDSVPVVDFNDGEVA